MEGVDRFDYVDQTGILFTVISKPQPGIKYKTVKEISIHSFPGLNINCYRNDEGHVKIYFPSPPWPSFLYIKDRFNESHSEDLGAIFTALISASDSCRENHEY